MGVDVGPTTQLVKTKQVPKQNKPQTRMYSKNLEKLSLGTWKVRTLYATGALTTVVSAIETYRLDIVAIQELRWTGSGSIRSNNHTVFYSCGTNHEARVGFIIKNDILPYVKNFIAYNERLCYIQVECKWLNMTLVNGYAPTEEKGNQIKEKFYSELDTIYGCIQKRIPKIIMGDFNAKIGKERVFEAKKAYIKYPMTTG